MSAPPARTATKGGQFRRNFSEKASAPAYRDSDSGLRELHPPGPDGPMCTTEGRSALMPRLKSSKIIEQTRHAAVGDRPRSARVTERVVRIRATPRICSSTRKSAATIERAQVPGFAQPEHSTQMSLSAGLSGISAGERVFNPANRETSLRAETHGRSKKSISRIIANLLMKRPVALRPVSGVEVPGESLLGPGRSGCQRRPSSGFGIANLKPSLA